MNAALKIFLSMSLSGSLLILAVLAAERLWRNRISRQWQYYIWLLVICRLLLPFGPETSLLGRPYQALERAVTTSLPPQSTLPTLGDASVPAAAPEQNSEHADAPADALPPAHPLQEVTPLLVNHIWVLWLAAALGLLLRKITMYQSFMRYIRAGWAPVSDTELLDRLSIAAERAGVQRPVELYVHPLISSPLLAGFFHPCIVLPSAELPEKDFQYIVLHELIHCRRGDLLYKWLVQVTVCLHWFNPLVHLMGREIARACEFSCDEAVLTEMGADRAQEYGRTLLDAMAAVGKYREHPGAVTLSENKQLLKERLSAIMSFGESSTAVRLLTGVLTLCVMLGTVFVGVYPAAAASDLPSHPPVSENKNSPQTGAETPKSTPYASQAEQSYKSGSLPLFQIAFSRLDEASQKNWLEKLYADGDFAFFSVAVNGLGEDSVLPEELAEKAYADEEIAFFSTLTDRMDEAELELWLDRALEDGNWAFQSMLFDKLDRYDEYDEWKDENEKKWAEAQAAEYRAAGVTWEGKNCYYQGQLVNIFLDVRPDKSFYTLDLNPAGTVNIKIVRGTDNKIKGVAYMTEAEVTALLTDMSDDDDWQETADGRIWHPQVIPVDCKVVKAGEVVWLGEYTLSEGDRIWYNVIAETGNSMQVGFAASGDARLDTTYYSVENLRQEGETLECTASFTVQPLAGPGTYQLFLRATDGALGNVKGSISIGYIADAS